MKQRAVAIADDEYVLAIEDIRDGRVHVVRTPSDLEPWLRSFKNGECVQPAFASAAGATRSTPTEAWTVRSSATASRVRLIWSRPLSSSEGPGGRGLRAPGSWLRAPASIDDPGRIEVRHLFVGCITPSMVVDGVGMSYEVVQQEVERLRTSGLREPFLLYSMGLRLRTLDYETLQTEDLLDGGDDKKVDFLHLDLESGVATVAQSYEAADWSREAAPSNKAADLGTAMNWLLESDLTDIPRGDVRAAAQELRDGLESGDIVRVEIFYVHNLPGSANVESELGTVKRATDRLLERFSRGSNPPPDCLVQEASISLVDDWRVSQHEAVSIEEEVVLESSSTPVELSTPQWNAVLMTLGAEDLVGLRVKYGDALSSANVRDYLGSRQSARNINRQIERTVQSEPNNFWIYNNGITILTKGLSVDGNKVKLQGIAVINGAQTTGTLAQAAAKGKTPLASASVMTRVITCNDPSLVENVIRYNNTQNPIKAWELRVIDPIQRQLADSFDKLGITYQTRRGQSRRRSSDVLYEKLGPYLAAFYGDPGSAHRNKAELFENEARYRQLFTEDAHVENLLFVYRLGSAVTAAKEHLRDRVVKGVATEEEGQMYDYFRYGAFPYVLMHVVAEVLAIWLSAQEPRFKRRVSLTREILLDESRSEDTLVKLVEAVLIPMHQYLSNSSQDAYQVIRLSSGVEALASHAKTIIRSVEQMQPDTYSEVTGHLTLVSA